MMDDFEDRMDDYFEYKIVSGELDDEEKDRKRKTRIEIPQQMNIILNTNKYTCR